MAYGPDRAQQRNEHSQIKVREVVRQVYQNTSLSFLTLCNVLFAPTSYHALHQHHQTRRPAGVFILHTHTVGSRRPHLSSQGEGQARASAVSARLRPGLPSGVLLGLRLRSASPLLPLGAALRVLRLAATRAAKGREGLVQLVVLLLRQPDRARNIRVADYRAGVEVDLHAVVIDNEYLITDD